MAKNDPVCHICLEAVTNGARNNGCAHEFCFPCITTWAANSNTCPACKKAFTEIIKVAAPGARRTRNPDVYKVRPKELAVDYDSDEIRRLNNGIDDSDDWMLSDDDDDDDESSDSRTSSESESLSSSSSSSSTSDNSNSSDQSRDSLSTLSSSSGSSSITAESVVELFRRPRFIQQSILRSMRPVLRATVEKKRDTFTSEEEDSIEILSSSSNSNNPRRSKRARRK